MSGSAKIAAIVESAPVLDDGSGGPEPEERTPFGGPDYRHEDHHDNDVDPGEGPSDENADGVDWDVVQICSRLDHSDTDNAERLIRYFGEDLTVLAQDGVSGGDWMGWTGSHWDLAGGKARAELIAQKLGGRIALEAHLLGTPTKEEKPMLEAGEAAQARIRRLGPDEKPSPDDRSAVAAAEALSAKIRKRRDTRRAFGVTSKNHGRIEKALACAAPRLRRPPEGFNADRYCFAAAGHTLRIVREIDDDFPNPDVTPLYRTRLDVFEGHRRDDWMTSVLPCGWAGSEAKAPRWQAFLERMLPDKEKRLTVQQFAGTSLLAVSPQFVMFHYGSGANGKSVFLETLTRILGPGFAVGLPRESLVGGSERGSGSASPDLVRLFGKRMVRILEVKGDVPLQEDLIKRLTGGEAFPVRSLFKGYFEFQSVATPHMSGNGMPTIDGTDNGIWRRMLVVHWDQTIPEEERADFEELVSGLVRDEGPGILAWLVEGARQYLELGLKVASSVRAKTDEYRDEMDPIGEFRKSCVRDRPGGRVQSRTMYESYKSWSMANAKRVRSETKFGRTMKEIFTRQEIGGRMFYLDCELHGVPDRPEEHGSPHERIPEPLF